jgi:23S rRNA pseudouridine1911/1915/1917 synthase
VPRLDVWLADKLGSRSAAQAAITEGRVTVDGVVRAKRFQVDGTEAIEIERGPVDTQEMSTGPSFAVVHEDDEVLVVDKPAGVVVHPGPGVRGPTLVEALAGRIAGGDDPDRPGVIHRLDRDTSGLILFARTPAAHSFLSAEMKGRRIEREYVALVKGRPAARTGTIDAPLGRDRRRRTLRSSDTDEPRPAVTHFTTEETFDGATLLAVTLETGRTHQIRAHFKAIGHPVLGDKEYGAPHPGLTRQFLHARRLKFAGREVRSDLPPDLVATLNAFRNPTPDAVPPVTDRGGRA